MLPSEQLRSILTKPFCSDYLDEIQGALEYLTPLTASQRVAVYVVRRTCIQLCSFLEGIEPVSVDRHDDIEKKILEPLVSVVRLLIDFKDVSFEKLAALIQASESARIQS